MPLTSQKNVDNLLDESSFVEEPKKKTKIKVIKFVTEDKNFMNDLTKELKVINHLEQTEETVPDSRINENMVQTWDDADEFVCISCKRPFNSLKDLLPYMLPCQHNACQECIKEKEEIGANFECPIDNCFIDRIDQAEFNNQLFKKVKIRERKIDRHQKD